MRQRREDAAAAEEEDAAADIEVDVEVLGLLVQKVWNWCEQSEKNPADKPEAETDEEEILEREKMMEPDVGKAKEDDCAKEGDRAKEDVSKAMSILDQFQTIMKCYKLQYRSYQFQMLLIIILLIIVRLKLLNLCT